MSKDQVEKLIFNFISESTWILIEPHFTSFGKQKLLDLIDFVTNHCIPAESIYLNQISNDPIKRWSKVPQIINQLKNLAKSKGLWNLFLSKSLDPDLGCPLSNLEYATMAEIMGHSIRIAPEAMNCSAPDTGNIELLARYGTHYQKNKWLKPLLNGTIRSSFSMTEPIVASSDATNIQTSITLDHQNQQIIINGRKWWISGAGDPRNQIHLVMGKSNLMAPIHSQHSIVLVPSNSPGLKLIRPMKVLGYDDAPEGHFEILYDNVKVPLENLIYDWGKGFEIVQSRLGPGRIHHCMRSIGLAERALTLMLLRVTDSKKITFGKQLFEHGTITKDIARSRIELDSARLLVYSAAKQIDILKPKGAMKSIGMAKAIVPQIVNKIIDRAIQVHGAEGLCQDQPLAAMFAAVRTLRLADGPDEVHEAQVAKQELKRVPNLRKSQIDRLEAQKKLENLYQIHSSDIKL